MSGPGRVLRECHIPWPAADEDALREAATTWHTLAETIRDNCGHANSAAVSLTSNNEGAAIDAFEGYWKKFGGPQGALPLAAEACDALSNACSKYADEVSATKNKIEEAGGEMTATLVVGTIGAFFTFGATEAAADATAAGLVTAAESAISALGASFLAEIPVIGSAIDALETVISALGSETGLSILSTGARGAMAGPGGTIFSDTAKDGVRGLYGQEPLSPSQVRDDLKDAAFEGGLGGVLGKLGALSAPQLAGVLRSAAGSVSTSDPQLFTQMMELSRQVEGTTGKVTNAVLSSAASQLVVTGHINAEGTASGRLRVLLQRVAEGKDGEG